MKILPFQTSFRPPIPTVRGNIEYSRFESQLKRMNQILIATGVERLAMEKSVSRYCENAKKEGIKVKNHHIRQHQENTIVALRCMILKSMLGVSFRALSIQLAHSPLYQWFCNIGSIGEVRVPSKSKIQGFIDIISEKEIEEIVKHLLQKTVVLELEESVDLERIWFDTTCVKTNIHYPVDWVLFRDATRTLVKAVIIIRQYGLKCRMSCPYKFLSRMNSLCMQMTQCQRKKDSKKTQKMILRVMKKLVTTIREHANRHYELLDKEWQKTKLSRKQAEVILKRISNVLEQLPIAVKQAHERIIGGRQVENKDKILSFYERETEVIVRGKSDAAVEFGNTFFLAEQAEGLIVDWKLFKDSAPADSALVKESILRIKSSLSIKVKAVGGDRGFDSKQNQKLLSKDIIFNGITPKDPKVLKEKMNDIEFIKSQKRRASTEARIGIFKNCFLGKILRAKGFENRASSIAWGVLAHNLWVLARLPKQQALKLAA